MPSPYLPDLQCVNACFSVLVFSRWLVEALISDIYVVQVLICDNMALPYRDDTFDAVLSIAVIHHIATTERRVRALRELARILRVSLQIYLHIYISTYLHNISTYLQVGGRIIISVWSMEQRHRTFQSQVTSNLCYQRSVTKQSQ